MSGLRNLGSRASGWMLAGALVALGSAAGAADPLRSSDPRQRAAAVRRAGERGEGAAVGRLIDLLRDDSAAVRLAAVQALLRLGDRRALRPLMVSAQSDFDERVRQAAARAVLQLDPGAFAAKLASADPPPVQPAAPPAPAPARPQRAATVQLGLTVDTLDLGDGPDGLLTAGLRWPRWDLQLGLRFPQLAQFGRLRCHLVVDAWLVPMIGVGYVVRHRGAFTPALGLTFGGGLRVQITPKLFAQLELWASRIVLRQRTAPDAAPSRWALPLSLSFGWEFWL